MTSNLNNLWVSYLQEQGYSGKSYNDLMRRSLQDQTSSTIKSINQLWYKYLGDLGFTGALNDRFNAWLLDKGYEGNLADRLRQALEADDVFAADPAPSGCTYPLNDDGTIASMFGYASAPANAPDYTRVDYNMGTSGAAGNGALTSADDPLGGDVVPKAGIKMAGMKTISASGDVFDWGGAGSVNSVAVLWGGGSNATTLNMDPDATGNLLVYIGGLGDGSPTAPGTVDTGVPWIGARVYIYVNGDTGQIGWSVNGVDKGYITGPDISASANFSPYMLVSNHSADHPDLDNRTISYEFLTSPEDGDETGFPAGTTDLCGNEIP